MAKPYYVEKVGVGVELFPARPKQEHLKAWGVGRYVFRTLDGKVTRVQEVVVNRNGNLKVIVGAPNELEALSLRYLEQLERLYEKVVRHWPTQAREAKKVRAEIDLRAEMVERAVVNFTEGEEVDDEWWGKPHFGGEG